MYVYLFSGKARCSGYLAGVRFDLLDTETNRPQWNEAGPIVALAVRRKLLTQIIMASLSWLCV